MEKLFEKFIAQDEASIRAYEHIISMIEGSNFDANSVKNVSLDMIAYFEAQIKRYEEGLRSKG